MHQITSGALASLYAQMDSAASHPAQDVPTCDHQLEVSPGMRGGLPICRGFPAISVTDSQRLLSPERVPSVVVTGTASVDQAVRLPARHP